MSNVPTSANFAHAQRPVPCDTCEDEVPGIYYCIECRKTFCEECEKSHKKFTKGHQIILRSLVGDIDTTIVSCFEHEENASFHCEKCKIPVCGKCVTGKHQGHKMVDILEIINRKKELLQGEIDTIKTCVLPNLERQDKELKIHRENYMKKIHSTTEEMERKNVLLHKELDRVHGENMRSLNRSQHCHLTFFDAREAEIERNINFFRRKVYDYQDIIGKNSLPSFSKIAETKESFPLLHKIQGFPEPPSFSPPNVKKIVENLGNLQMVCPQLPLHLEQIAPTIVSKFKSPLKGRPRICVTKEGNVLLGSNDTKKIVMVNSKGEVFWKRDIPNKPYAVAVMDCGDLIISPHEGKSVKRLTKDGKVHDVFDPSPFECLGVSITTDQNVLICTTNGRVLKSNSNGTEIKEIFKGPNNSTVHAVEGIDRNIYISNHNGSAVMVVSNVGKILTSITHSTRGQKLTWPKGLVADSIGNILCADRDQNCIYIIDQNMLMKEFIGQNYEMKTPCFLAVDGHRNIWITERDGNITVVKYLAEKILSLE